MPQPTTPSARMLAVVRARGAFLGLNLTALVHVSAPSLATSQEPGDGRLSLPGGLFVDSERERYLRALQAVGLARPYPWGIRGFSDFELDRLRPLSDRHPWADHPRFSTSRRRRAIRLEPLPASITTWYNTANPFGMNDGAVWAGRGLTTAAQLGLAARLGPVSIVLAPIAFRAENRPFPLMPNGEAADLRFADPLYPLTVDRPQRFGDRAYAAVDPGQSTIRLDLLGVALGVSTANQWWGPMTEFPFLLGSNAAGFPHAFFGASRPVNIGIGRMHGRVVYGELAQSSYTNVTGPTQRRFASGIVGVFSPRGLPGLELGGARFFHNPWPEDGITSRLRQPIEGLLEPRTDPDFGVENQLASVFARWVLPRSGFEVYAEYGREDHSHDITGLLQEPDHAAAYGLGMQKVWMAPTGGGMTVLRGELMNFEVPVLARLVRGAGFGTYVHPYLRQGHTHRGQLLGAGFAVGSGAGATLGVDRYTQSGRTSVEWLRLVRRETWGGEPAARCATCSQVEHVLRGERLHAVRRFDLRYGAAAVFEMNRYFERRDTVNVNFEVELRVQP